MTNLTEFVENPWVQIVLEFDREYQNMHDAKVDKREVFLTATFVIVMFVSPIVPHMRHQFHDGVCNTVFATFFVVTRLTTTARLDCNLHERRVSRVPQTKRSLGNP